MHTQKLYTYVRRSPSPGSFAASLAAKGTTVMGLNCYPPMADN
jgi:hypothetical protein